MDTKSRILDAAESLFAERGFAGASLRDITALAQVNLAAANYHFGTKDGLLRAVVERRLLEINGQRLARLDALEARPSPPSLEELVEAFVGPPLEAAWRPHGRDFVRVMARLHSDPEGAWQRVLDPNWFVSLMERFRAAFGRCLPELDPDTLSWRVHLAIGAMAHVILHGEHALCPRRELDPETILAQLTDFLCGGLRQPVHEPRGLGDSASSS